MSAADAIDSWIDAASPLRQAVTDAVVAMRKLVAAKALSVSDINNALDDLEGSGNALDVWLDQAGSLRQRFANALTVLRTVACASDGAPRSRLAVAQRLIKAARGRGPAPATETAKVLSFDDDELWIWTLF